RRENLERIGAQPGCFQCGVFERRRYGCVDPDPQITIVARQGARMKEGAPVWRDHSRNCAVGGTYPNARFAARRRVCNSRRLYGKVGIGAPAKRPRSPAEVPPIQILNELIWQLDRLNTTGVPTCR